MTEEELKEFEKGRRQILSLDPATTINMIANVVISNQAMLETILASQAVVFQRLFPEKTKEEHHQAFKEKCDRFKAEILIQTIKDYGDK